MAPGRTPDPAPGDDRRHRVPPAAAPGPEDSAEELYDAAPCGFLSTAMDGTVVKVNATLLDWLGRERREVVGRMRFADLLTVGGKLYYETHFAPLLGLRGEIGGIALEMRTATGGRLPVLVSAAVKRDAGGEPVLIRTTVFDASDRRAYEEELLRRRRAADEARDLAEAARREAEAAHREAEAARREAEAARSRSEADRARLTDALVVLQQALLPADLPTVPGLDVASYYYTASPDRLGGDFYDLFALGAGRWAFFLGDVSGKGPRAAAVTSLTRYTLRAAVFHDSDPVSALSTLNAVLYDRYGLEADPRHCTAVVGVVEPDAARGRIRVRLASGGHPPALVLRAGAPVDGPGRADYLTTPGGMLVGALPDAVFTPATAVLDPGDTLLLYTDGLTEARMDPDRSVLYGDERLRDFAARQVSTAPGDVIAAVADLLEKLGDGVDDDTALLALGAPSRPG
ncbi:PP2C family protein-serine/threonine phosphatase [Streptomyces sp. MPA0124]|uniref:PP2C family protein-serine/threonine phosphatase n=1 Tax=unclassified Streptomyces TaxID=2593676 RepID=UPI00362C599C